MRTIVLAFTAATVGMCGTAFAGEGPSEKRQAFDRIQGSRAYAEACVTCHGPTGTGDAARAAGVPDFTTPQAVVTFSREKMLDGARKRHDAQLIAAWKDQGIDQELEAIVSYMREAFMLPAPVEDASLGRKIYAETCSVCHGDRGNGASWAQHSLKPSPANFRSEKVRELSRRHMINTVTYGSKDTAMVGFASQLSRSEIAAVVDYIRGTFMTAAGTPASGNADAAIPKLGKFTAAARNTPAPAAHDDHGSHAAHGHDVTNMDMDAPLPNGLVADIAAGKKLFNETCAECHGESGAGDGRRAYFIRPKPADLTSAESREELNRPHLFSAISKGVNGTEMPAWSKVLTDQQIANVAGYVFSAFIRPEGAADADGHDHAGHDHASHDHDSHDHAAAAPETEKKKH